MAVNDVGVPQLAHGAYRERTEGRDTPKSPAMLQNTSTPTNPDPLLTVRQAEEYAGLSASLFRRRIADHSLPVVRFGARAVRIRKSDLDDYLASGDK